MSFCYEVSFYRSAFREKFISFVQRCIRRRNVTLYNPPCSKNVKTNVARDFLRLIDKHFPPSHKLHTKFNRHTIRVSYSCMTDMKTFIQKHNKHILSEHEKRKETQNPVSTDNQPTTNNQTQTCNCRERNECPLAGTCLSKSIVYQADVSTPYDGQTKSYIGITANQFKDRYRNHVKSFEHKKYEKSTELSKYIWSLKENNRQFSIKWSILKHARAYKPGSSSCGLCLEEKLQIMKRKHKNLLYKRNEFFSKCRHVKGHLITKRHPM